MHTKIYQRDCQTTNSHENIGFFKVRIISYIETRENKETQQIKQCLILKKQNSKQTKFSLRWPPDTFIW